MFAENGTPIAGAEACASTVGCLYEKKGIAMLYYAGVFFVIAIIAALFGFGGIAASAAGIAKILFYIFILVALVSLVMGLIRR